LFKILCGAGGGNASAISHLEPTFVYVMINVNSALELQMLVIVYRFIGKTCTVYVGHLQERWQDRSFFR